MNPTHCNNENKEKESEDVSKPLLNKEVYLSELQRNKTNKVRGRVVLEFESKMKVR